ESSRPARATIVSASSVTGKPRTRTVRRSSNHSQRVTRAMGERALEIGGTTISGRAGRKPTNRWRAAADAPATTDGARLSIAADTCLSHVGAADANAYTPRTKRSQAPDRTRYWIMLSVRPAL